MASTTDMNIVLGQGNAIKEVHNVRKQSLELNQQFVAQKAEDKKKEDQSKVQQSEAENRVEIKGDEEREKRKDPEDDQKDPEKEKLKEDDQFSGKKHLIDIKV